MYKIVSHFSINLTRVIFLFVPNPNALAYRPTGLPNKM